MYKWDSTSIRKNCDELKIKYLLTDTNEFYFRLFDANIVIEIWTNNYKTFYCTLTNYAYKISKNKPDKLFLTKTNIDANKAKQAYSLIIADSIIPILTSPNVYLTNKSFDVGTYSFEFSNKNAYSSKFFYKEDKTDTASIFQKQIKSFVERLYLCLGLSEILQRFSKSLPYGIYSGEGFTVWIHTRKMERFLKRRK